MRMRSKSGLLAACAAALLGVMGCTSEPETGSAVVQVALDGTTPSDVTRVELIISGSGIATPIATDLAFSSGQWQGAIEGIPSGSERDFTATAYDAAGVALYAGSAPHVTILPRKTAVVAILAQELNPPDPFENASPEVTALYADSVQAGPSEALPVRAEVLDVDPDAVLTYAWTATGGTFDDASALSAVWTAPATTGAVTLAFTVTDQHGAQGTASFVIDVQEAFGNGAAEIAVTFNTWPRIQQIIVSPNPVQSGQATQVTLAASDVDGDWLAYEWSSDCAGTFGAQAAVTTFTPTGADGTCLAQVVVTDGRGGSMSGQLTFRVGAQPDVNTAPSFTAFSPAVAVSGGDTTPLFVEATEANGSPLTFSWSATAGTLGTAASTTARSDVSWTAPTCLAIGQAAIVIANVTDADGQQTSMPFHFSGFPACGAITTAALIPSSGGTITTSSGAKLLIPAGALDEPTAISINETATPAPAEYGGTSQLYVFEPAGTVFAKPVPIRFPLPSGVSEASVYWSTADGAGYEAIGGTIEGNEIVAQVVHFSSGFVGASSSSRSVTGSRVITWASASGTINEELDLTTSSIEALVPDADGGYASYTGTGTTAGTFSIPNVPVGAYLLRVDSLYTWTDNDVIDLGRTVQGRPGLVRAPEGTRVEFTADGMAPWEEGDSLEAFSSEADTWKFGMEWAADAANLPAPGATSVTALSFDLPSTLGYLVEGSKGDRMTLAQLENRQSDNGFPYLAMSRVFEAPAFDMLPGVTTAVPAGTFSDVAANNTISLDVRAEEFLSYAPAFGTNAIPYPSKDYWGFSVAVLGHAGGLEHGAFGATADLLISLNDYTVPNFTTGTMNYGTPLNGLWGAYGDVRFTYSKRFQLPDTIGPSGGTSVGLGSAESVAEFAADPVRPVVTPVQNPTLDGQSLFAPVTITSTQPVVAWTAPALGVPTEYTVRVFEVYKNDEPRTRHRNLYALTTTETSVQLPAGWMVGGGSYAVLIMATIDSYPDADRAPFRSSFPSAYAQFLSELVSIAP